MTRVAIALSRLFVIQNYRVSAEIQGKIDQDSDDSLPIHSSNF